jgi:hypothetical protein
VATLAMSVSAQDATTCECGLTGENCADLAEGFKSALNVTCNTFDEDATCKAKNGEPRCLCSRGVQGEFCTLETRPQSFNFAVGFIAVVLFTFASAYFLRKHHKATGFSEFNRPS